MFRKRAAQGVSESFASRVLRHIDRQRDILSRTVRYKTQTGLAGRDVGDNISMCADIGVVKRLGRTAPGQTQSLVQLRLMDVTQSGIVKSGSSQTALLDRDMLLVAAMA